MPTTKTSCQTPSFARDAATSVEGEIGRGRVPGPAWRKIQDAARQLVLSGHLKPRGPQNEGWGCAPGAPIGPRRARAVRIRARIFGAVLARPVAGVVVGQGAHVAAVAPWAELGQQLTIQAQLVRALAELFGGPQAAGCKGAAVSGHPVLDERTARAFRHFELRRLRFYVRLCTEHERHHRKDPARRCAGPQQ